VFAFDQRLRLAIGWLDARVRVLADELPPNPNEALLRNADT
jgi:hypothetical protein